MLEPLEIEAAILAHCIDDDGTSWLVCAIVEPIELFEGLVGMRGILRLVMEVI